MAREITEGSNKGDLLLVYWESSLRYFRKYISG